MTSNFRKTKLSSVISILALAPMIASSAMGQTSMLEEIIVTATKKAVNAQEIPIAITAINGDILNDLGIY